MTTNRMAIGTAGYGPPLAPVPWTEADMAGEHPRRFALTRDDGDSSRVIGYGLVLPDGAVYSIAWPTAGASIWSTSSAEQVADLRGADLHWIDKP